MPRYFFDISDNELEEMDDRGIDLQDDVEARHKAIESLPDLARDLIPNGDSRCFVVKVRTDENRAVYRATLWFQGEWNDGPDPQTAFALGSAR